MNIKRVKNPGSTTCFENIAVGEVFYDPEFEYYCVKTSTFRDKNLVINAMRLSDMMTLNYPGNIPVILCHHEINVWY